jgi:four helix bundle protein
MAIEFYKDLEVWQMAMTLRRAAVSIPANIAEGYGRDQTGSFVQFLRIAQGSARELETHLIWTERLQLTGAKRWRRSRKTASGSARCSEP